MKDSTTMQLIHGKHRQQRQSRLYLLMISLSVFITLSGGACKREDSLESRATSSSLSEIIGFTNWTVITPANYQVSQELAEICRAMPTITVGTSGPHAGVPVAVFANLAAATVLTNKTKSGFSKGSVIVKVKYLDGLEEPSELGVMLKREPGYDGEGGDWEYTFVRLKPASLINRGRIENCRNCHRKQKDHDFIFAAYANR
jgi:hypothetical protein